MNRKKYYAIFACIKKVRYGKNLDIATIDVDKDKLVPRGNGRYTVNSGLPYGALAIAITGKRLPTTREELALYTSKFIEKFIKKRNATHPLTKYNYALLGYRYGMDGGIHDAQGEVNEIIK